MKELWHDVYLENDAVMVGLGEAVYGAGKDNKIVAYVTLSTGVGGCRIVDGKPDPTVYSFEPGNMIVGGLDGKPEYLENIISGSAIEEKYGVGSSELTDQKAWEDIAEQTSIGLNNIAVMWSPNVIVLGGSVPQKLDFSRVNDHLRVHCRIYPEVPKVIKEDLGDEGGLYGALAYLRHLP
jgi:glucokinase